MVIVVTQEKPAGSSRRYGSETSRRKARRPELRSGIRVGPCDDLAAGLLGADAPGRAGAAVATEREHAQVRIALLGPAQHLEGVVGARVVDAEDLVGQLAREHRGGDAVDLVEHVGALVEAGQHDRDVGHRAGAVGAVLDDVGRVAGSGACHGVSAPRDIGGRRVVAATGHLAGAHRDALGGSGVDLLVARVARVARGGGGGRVLWFAGARRRSVGVLAHRERAYPRAHCSPADPRTREELTYWSVLHGSDAGCRVPGVSRRRR